MTKFVRSLMFVFIVMSFVLAACAPATTETPTQAPQPTELQATEVPATDAPTEAPAEDPLDPADPPDPVASSLLWLEQPKTAQQIPKRHAARFMATRIANNMPETRP